MSKLTRIRVKGCKMIAWMGLAMMVSTRLWLGGVVSLTRDRSLADRLLAQVRVMLSAPACAAGVYRRLERVPGQYPTGVSRESQRDRRTRASLFASVAAVVHRCGDQTDGKETRGGGHAQDGSGNAGTSAGAAFGFSGRNRAQYRLYRALERHHTPTTRQLDAQVSACGQAPDGSGKWDVAAWLYLQSLLAPSRVEPT